MPDVLNNRERAGAMWLAIVLVICLVRPELRSSVRTLVRIVLSPKVLLPLLGMGAWIALVVILAREAGIWDTTLIGGTIVWFGSAVVLFVNAADGVKDRHYVRRTIRGIARIGVLVAAFVGLYVFPLWVEVVLLPFVVLFAGVATVAERKPEDASAKLVATVLLGWLGLAVIVYASVHAAFDGVGHVLRGVLLPVWLGLAVLPYAYLVGLLAAYEVAFLQIRFCDPSPEAARRAKLALILGVGPRAHRLDGFARFSAARLVAAPSFRAARRLAANLSSEQG